MRFLRALRQDLNKTLINAGFAAAAIMTCILGFTASAYVDISNERSYSVFEAYFTFGKEFISQHSEFASVLLFRNGLTGYVNMFLPIIVAFPFMVSFCAERNSGLMRFTVTRTGKYPYYLSKFFASFISGGLAVFLGMILFGIVVWISFPSYKSYNFDAETLEWMLPGGIYKVILKCLLSAFLYGAFSTLPAFFLSSFCKNPYIITCLPFMLTYVWTTTLNKLQNKLYQPGNYDHSIAARVEAFRPDSVRQLVYIDKLSEITEAQRLTLIFNSAYLIVLLVGFIFIMELRTDKGS